MTIIDKIKGSVESATGLPMYYDTPETLNLRLDNAQLPCAMLNIVSSGAVTDDNGIVRERLTVEVLFADLSRLDFDGTDVEREQLDRMKRLGLGWIAQLRRSPLLALDSINGTTRYYATNDAIVAAYGVNVTLTEREGVSPCDIV